MSIFSGISDYNSLLIGLHEVTLICFPRREDQHQKELETLAKRQEILRAQIEGVRLLSTSRFWLFYIDLNPPCTAWSAY